MKHIFLASLLLALCACGGGSGGTGSQSSLKSDETMAFFDGAPLSGGQALFDVHGVWEGQKHRSSTIPCASN